MVDVSIVVCTYNRAESLRETLETLVSQNRSGMNYEIIVVDNNSKDHTKKIAQSFNGQLKYVFEPKQGLSYARNTGIKQATGQIIAFTDDDVIVDQNWVSNVFRCFQETQALMVAGKIERLWTCQRPAWLTEEISGPLIVQDLGPLRKRWDSGTRHTVGANMAFRRIVFEKFGFFQEELGRRGNQLIGGEDREIFRRIFESGGRIFYEPKAVVHHKVEKERLSKSFMQRWFRDVGATLGHQIPWRWHYSLTIAPLWLWKNWIIACFKLINIFLKPVSNEAERFACEIWFQHYSAMMRERFLHWIPLGVGKTFCVFDQKN